MYATNASVYPPQAVPITNKIIRAINCRPLTPQSQSDQRNPHYTFASGAAQLTYRTVPRRYSYIALQFGYRHRHRRLILGMDSPHHLKSVAVALDTHRDPLASGLRTGEAFNHLRTHRSHLLPSSRRPFVSNPSHSFLFPLSSYLFVP